jgi:hypothetical protein
MAEPGRPAGLAPYREPNAARRLHKNGISPLEVLVWTMREAWEKATDKKTGDIINFEKAKEAAELAVQAAPYMHPRLQHVKAEVEESERVKIILGHAMSEEEWQLMYGAQQPKALTNGSNGHNGGGTQQ